MNKYESLGSELSALFGIKIDGGDVGKAVEAYTKKLAQASQELADQELVPVIAKYVRGYPREGMLMTAVVMAGVFQSLACGIETTALAAVDEKGD